MDKIENANRLLDTLTKWVDFVNAQGIWKILKGFFVMILLVGVAYYLSNPTKIFEVYDKFETDQHNAVIKQRFELTKNVNAELLKMREDMKASRIFIQEFHNGKENLSSMPFLYYSMKFEVLDDKTESVYTDFQGLSTNRYKFMSYLYENQSFAVDTKAFKIIDSELYNILSAQDIHYSMYSMIYDLNGIPIAFIGVHWNNDNYKVFSEGTLKNIFNRYVQKIVGMYNVTKYKTSKSKSRKDE